MSSRTAIVAFAALLPFAPSSLSAQGTLAREVDFVRSLASDLGFIKLAQAEVARLQQSYRQSDDFKLVSQLGIEIALEGARKHRVRAEQRALFKDALDKSRAFIDRYDGEAVADQARLTLVESCYEFGQFLLQEIDIAREEAPEKVKELEEGAAGVYRNGIAACREAKKRLEEWAGKPETDEGLDYYKVWLFEGILQREQARAVKRDRDPLCSAARDTLEELIFDIGEQTALGMRAFFELAKIGEVLDDLGSAARDYTDTIDSIKDALTNEDLNLTPAAQEFLFNLMQEAYDRATTVMFLQGDIEQVREQAQKFRDHLAQFGQQDLDAFDVAHPRFGHLVFLTEAQAMAESGDGEQISLALGQAQKINDKHPSDFIGIKAKAVIKDILLVQGGVVDPALLVEVAKGELQSKNFEVALNGCKRALAAMAPADLQKYGLEVYTMMCRAYGLEQRFLEATLAGVKGLELYGNTPGANAESTANMLKSAWGSYRRNAKGGRDAALNPLSSKVTTMLGRFGGAESAAKLSYDEGNQRFDERAYAEAAAEYAKVPDDTIWFEPAQARIVTAWQMAKDYSKARGAIASYRQWLTTPAAKIPAKEQSREVNRLRTIASMEYYEVSMGYQEATGDQADSTQFGAILQSLQQFASNQKQHGRRFLPNVYNMTARLQAQLGDVDQAEATYNVLRSEFRGDPVIAPLATAIFAAHVARVKNYEVEYNSLIKDGADDAKLKPVQDKLKAARRSALNSGVDYANTADKPQYAILDRTLGIARGLQEWGDVEKLGRQAVELYGEDPEQASKVAGRIKPAIGEAMMKRETPDPRGAVALLEAAIAENDKNWAAMRLLNLAQGGWIQYDEALNLELVPGGEEPDKAYDRHWGSYKKFALNPSRGVQDYDLDWYRFYWECYQFAFRAKGKGPKYQRAAGSLYRIARANDDFKTLRDLGEEGRMLYDFFQRYK